MFWGKKKVKQIIGKIILPILSVLITNSCMYMNVDKNRVLSTVWDTCNNYHSPFLFALTKINLSQQMFGQIWNTDSAVFNVFLHNDISSQLVLETWFIHRNNWTPNHNNALFGTTLSMVKFLIAKNMSVKQIYKNFKEWNVTIH